jgi:hypothetical protein
MHERSPWQTSSEINSFLMETYEFLDETCHELEEVVGKSCKHLEKRISRRLPTLSRKQDYLQEKLENP